MEVVPHLHLHLGFSRASSARFKFCSNSYILCSWEFKHLGVGPSLIVSLDMGSMLNEVVSYMKKPILYLKLAFTSTFFAVIFQASHGFLSGISGMLISLVCSILEIFKVEWSNPSLLSKLKIEMLTPKDHIGLIIELAQDRRVFKEMNHITENRASITYRLPLAKENNHGSTNYMQVLPVPLPCKGFFSQIPSSRASHPLKYIS